MNISHSRIHEIESDISTLSTGILHNEQRVRDANWRRMDVDNRVKNRIQSIQFSLRILDFVHFDILCDGRRHWKHLQINFFQLPMV